jgi:hypothetical protein
MQSVSYRVGVFAVCVVALWTNYQKMQADEAATTFLQEFSCDDFRASAEKPDDAAVEGERGRAKKDELLQIFAEVNLLSFKLVLLASILCVASHCALCAWPLADAPRRRLFPCVLPTYDD